MNTVMEIMRNINARNAPLIADERNRLMAEITTLKAEAKAAAKAPAKFRRITPETVITAPCVLARVEGGTEWIMKPVHTEAGVAWLRSDYTHWLPIQWPEVRG